MCYSIMNVTVINEVNFMTTSVDKGSGCHKSKKKTCFDSLHNAKAVFIVYGGRKHKSSINILIEWIYVIIHGPKI